VWDNRNFVCSQKRLGEDGSVSRCVVVVKQPGLFWPNLGTMSSHFFTQSPQNFTVEPTIHSLVSWDTFFVHNPLDVKESDDLALQIAFHPVLIFGLGDVGFFHWKDCRFVSDS